MRQAILAAALFVAMLAITVSMTATEDASAEATMRFDTTSQVVDDARSAERALWEGLRLASEALD